eukprot:GEMP01014853.1.p1 GENE.GEMP01014853.1~~GEMP01014853.1.p1  ORF type:complete len:320 (+),score=62.85 GEMP01014853.1:385-1344(+)
MDDRTYHWTVAMANPFSIHFTQTLIHASRDDVQSKITTHRGAYGGLGDVALIAPFSSIRVFEYDQHLWTLDNWKLYTLQCAAMERWPRRCVVRVLFADTIPTRSMAGKDALDATKEYLSSYEGKGVSVLRDSLANWNWYDEATKRELESLHRLTSLLFSIFECLPILYCILRQLLRQIFVPQFSPLLLCSFFSWGIDRSVIHAPIHAVVCDRHIQALVAGGGAKLKLPSFLRQCTFLGEDFLAPVVSLPYTCYLLCVILVNALPYGIVIVLAEGSLLTGTVRRCVAVWLGIFLVHKNTPSRDMKVANPFYTGNPADRFT